MATLLDYIELRGDLKLLDYPYTEIDYAALANIAYVDFEGVIDMQTTCMTLKEVDHLVELKNLSNKYVTLLKAMANSPRYENILVMKYMAESNEELVMQFAAITFVLEDGRIVVSFRGTDHTLLGWKEDFLMLYKEMVPSEEKAVEYLNEIQYTYNRKEVLKDPYFGKNLFDRLDTYKRYSNELPITFVGHSKGGHLAIYCGTLFQKEVYNFDGPGMNILLEDYEKNKEHVHSYIPEYSLFGRFFEHKEVMHVVKSVNDTYKEHTVFSWVVSKDGFVEGIENQDSIKAVQNVFTFLDSLSNEEREEFITNMFKVFDHLGLKTIEDIKKINYHKVFSSLDLFIRMDSKARNNMVEMMTILINEFR